MYHIETFSNEDQVIGKQLEKDMRSVDDCQVNFKEGKPLKLTLYRIFYCRWRHFVFSDRLVLEQKLLQPRLSHGSKVLNRPISVRSVGGDVNINKVVIG